MRAVLLLALLAVLAVGLRDEHVREQAAPGMVKVGSHALFVQNDGQWERDVRYVAPGRSRVRRWDRWCSNCRSAERVGVAFSCAFGSWGPMRAGVEPRGELPGDARRHFFLGVDPEGWRTGVRAYSRVRYASIYEGIDLVLHEQAGKAKYDLLVAPGADLSQVVLDFEGSDGVSVSAEGELLV
jgi:hypothetical protein